MKRHVLAKAFRSCLRQNKHILNKTVHSLLTLFSFYNYYQTKVNMKVYF